MPTGDGFRLNNENRPLPARPEATQKSPEELIGQRQRGRDRFRTIREICCRKARFSSKRSWRERKNRTQSTIRTHNISNISPRSRENPAAGYYPDFKENRNSCEAQPPPRCGSTFCGRQPPASGFCCALSRPLNHLRQPNPNGTQTHESPPFPRGFVTDWEKHNKLHLPQAVA
jgi:hypothetical protein